MTLFHFISCKVIDLVTNCLYIFENIYIYICIFAQNGNFGSILGYVRLSGEWKKYSIQRRLKNIGLDSKKYHWIMCILYWWYFNYKWYFFIEISVRLSRIIKCKYLKYYSLRFEFLKILYNIRTVCLKWNKYLFMNDVMRAN